MSTRKRADKYSRKKRRKKDINIIAKRVAKRAKYKCERIIDGKRCNSREGLKAHEIDQEAPLSEENFQLFCQRCRDIVHGKISEKVKNPQRILKGSGKRWID